VQRWHDVLLALQQAHPQRDRGWRIELPPGGRGLVTGALPQARRDGRRLLQAAAGERQPATGQVLANRFWGDFAATWVFDLHYMLLAGDAGRTVVGVLGLLMTASGGRGWCCGGRAAGIGAPRCA
jgi:uncharacterized iron-regulated membrane protein